MALLARRGAAGRVPLATSTRRPLVRPCRYTSGGGDPRGDRFAETVLFTAPDDDAAGGAALTPASQSVMIALLEKRIPFRHTLVRHDAPDNGLTEFRELYAAANPAGGARPSPPLLADCGALICGPSSAASSSSDPRIILEYLAERYRAVGTPLIPSNAATAATMRLFISVFDESVALPFRRFVRVPPGDKAALTRAKEEFFEGWRRVDGFLLAHAHGAPGGFDALDAGAEMLYGQHRAFVVRPPQASRASIADEDEQAEEEQERVLTDDEEEGLLDGRPPFAAADPIVDRDFPPPPPRPPSPSSSSIQGAYLLGRAYSLAEVATTPHVARMAALLPAVRGLELVASLREQGLERAASWVEASLARPSAVATDPTADELVGGLAAAEWARA